MDYYQTLGINRDADTKEIKLAYRKLASKHHPDKGGSAEEFKKIQEAYSTLSDPDTRQQYDNPSPFGQGQGGSPFGDIFGDFFNQHRQHRRQGNPESVGDVQITLQQAYTGTDLSIGIDGKSTIIEIAPGTRDGSRIRLHQQGRQPHAEFPPGDLIIRIHVDVPPEMGIKDNDLYQHVLVNAIEVMTGVSKMIDHVSGKKLQVKIPAGSQHGTRLRLSNQGMPYPGAPQVYGSLFVIVNIDVPRILDPKHIEMLNSINKEI